MRRWNDVSLCKYCGMLLGIGNIFDARIVIRNNICMCANCYQERKNMPNIKITAEVDGKIVPLNTISTESFEAIKALEKPKEIPVARVGNYGGSPRLFLKITDSIRKHAIKENLIAIRLTDGYVSNHWRGDQDISNFYDDVKPL